MGVRWYHFRCSECGGLAKIVAVDKGYIQPLIPCIVSCQPKATMRVVETPILHGSPADGEFYHPSPLERSLMRKRAPKLVSWVERGGLVLRAPRSMYMFKGGSDEGAGAGDAGPERSEVRGEASGAGQKGGQSASGQAEGGPAYGASGDGSDRADALRNGERVR